MTRDALIFLPAKVVEGVLLMLVTSLYADLFSTDAVAMFRYVNTSVQFSYLILSGWMANAATRYVGEQVAQDEGRSLYSTVCTIYLIILTAVGAVCGVLFAITREGLFLAGILMFASYTAFQILNAMLVQLGKIRASVILSLTSASLKLLVAYLLVGGSAGHYPTAYPAVFANAIADGVASLGAIWALGIPAVFSFLAFSRPTLRRLFSFGAPLMGVSVSVGLLNVVDTYLFGIFAGKAPLAIYSQNYTIGSSIFTMINVAVMRGVYPNVLRAWRTGGLKEAKPQLDRGVRLYLLLALPAAAGLCAVSRPLCQLLFPAVYHPASPVIGLTACAMVCMGLTEYANKAYELEADTMPVLQNSMTAAVVKIISSCLLLHFVGYLGAAWGSLLSFGVYLGLTVLRVRKRFLFHVPLRSWVRISLSALGCFAAAWPLGRLPLSPLVRLCLAIPAGAGVYVLILALSGEIRQELLWVRRRLSRHS